MTARKKTADIPEKFEEALERLEKIVERLESGESDLEESLALYEEGERLSRHCLERLQAMEQRVRKVIERENGEVELREMDVASEPDDGDSAR